MPLDRQHVTSASRIMLPTYAAVTFYLGVVYTFDPLGRNAANNGLDVLRTLGIPVWMWGVLFLAVSALMFAALITPERRLGTHRRAFVFALYVAAVVMALWALVYLGSALFASAPLTAPVWPLLAMQACRASARSLIRGEK